MATRNNCLRRQYLNNPLRLPAWLLDWCLRLLLKGIEAYWSRCSSLLLGRAYQPTSYVHAWRLPLFYYWSHNRNGCPLVHHWEVRVDYKWGGDLDCHCHELVRGPHGCSLSGLAWAASSSAGKSLQKPGYSKPENEKACLCLKRLTRPYNV